jgi:hypothetical protein
VRDTTEGGKENNLTLVFTQPLTEMSTRGIKIMFLGSKAVAGA